MIFKILFFTLFVITSGKHDDSVYYKRHAAAPGMENAIDNDPMVDLHMVLMGRSADANPQYQDYYDYLDKILYY